MSKTVFIYLPEGFADWEGALLMAELRESKRSLKIISENGEPVMSIGGMKVFVEGSLKDMSPENTEALVLIGSDSWVEAQKNQKVLEMAKDFYKRGIIVAGICAATVALARIGLLEERKHTSNDLPMLKKIVPTYRGDKNYQEKLAVTDGNLITAPGIAPVDFTFEIMKAINLYNETKRQQWFAMFKHGTKPPLEFWTS